MQEVGNFGVKHPSMNMFVTKSFDTVTITINGTAGSLTVNYQFSKLPDNDWVQAPNPNPNGPAYPVLFLRKGSKLYCDWGYQTNITSGGQPVVQDSRRSQGQEQTSSIIGALVFFGVIITVFYFWM